MSGDRIVFLDRASIPTHITIPTPITPHEWVEYKMTSAEHTVERSQHATIIVTNKVVLSGETLKQLPQLKHIAIIATGYNNVDIDTCRELGISVSNTRGYADTSVPEHTIALIFTLQRHILDYQYSVKQGEWQRSPHFHHFLKPTQDLAHSQIGIIGSGSLGQGTAKLAKALGMKVVFADRKNTPPSGKPNFLPFAEIIQQSDIISLHCPLTTDTKNLITIDEMQQMKDSALLINTARGGLINEADLTTAIEQGIIAGAGLDVVEQEPVSANNPLLTLMHRPNFILTPHIAWTSSHAMQTQANLLLDNINSFIRGEAKSLVV
jgi:glycerate dehydrogenase